VEIEDSDYEKDEFAELSNREDSKMQKGRLRLSPSRIELKP